MTTNEPNYNDVGDLKDGFEAWRHTYEYRGIKYDIAFLHRRHSRWFVVERHEETRDLVNLISTIDMRPDFLYHVCDDDEPRKAMFYDAADRAKEDIDWFLDDSLTDIANQITNIKNAYLDVCNAIDEINKGEESDD